MAILLELDIVIVVSSNTLGLFDLPDLVLQLLINKIMGGGVTDDDFINVAIVATVAKVPHSQPQALIEVFAKQGSDFVAMTVNWI